MEIRTLNVTIGKDAMTKPTKELWVWELPVFEEMFAEGMVEVYGESSVERESLPDPIEERARLIRVYGGEGAESYFSFAYGRGKAGERAFAKAIKDSVVKPTVPVGKAPEKT